MFIAHDINGNRVHAKLGEKGQTYTCPSCGNQVKLKQGKVNRAHFAHIAKEPCPFDKDAKSEWHMHMQELFPPESLEIRFIDNNTGEVHIADVFLKESNTVIEFQNSKISEEEFVSRTLFHTNEGRRIVWVFNERSTNAEAITGRFKQEDDSRVTRWHTKLHYYWQRCPRKTLRAIRSTNSKVSVLQMPNYSICVNYDDTDVVHRIVAEDFGFQEVWMSVHDITLCRDMDVNEFFTPEPEFLKDEIATYNYMQQRRTATYVPIPRPKVVRRSRRF